MQGSVHCPLARRGVGFYQQLHSGATVLHHASLTSVPWLALKFASNTGRRAASTRLSSSSSSTLGQLHRRLHRSKRGYHLDLSMPPDCYTTADLTSSPLHQGRTGYHRLLRWLPSRHSAEHSRHLSGRQAATTPRWTNLDIIHRRRLTPPLVNPLQSPSSARNRHRQRRGQRSGHQSTSPPTTGSFGQAWVLNRIAIADSPLECTVTPGYHYTSSARRPSPRCHGHRSWLSTTATQL